ncbi:MAG: hypothetical protein CMK07_06780 [Ponticaulis sp.]|mgnify:CR=1 FL=1|nr:hypothetical protein [Ponticaulis sp.]
MFKTPVICLGASLLTMFAIPASASEVGEVSVNPGYWNWSHLTRLAGIEFSEENTECLPEENATLSLEDLAESLDQACALSDVNSTAAGYEFTLTCDGFYSGVAHGTMTKYSDDSVGMQATGSVKLAGAEADFDFNAEATRVGTCPAG